jgi:hypothetical protein|tara:strand:- start:55005 stop:55616 length:612 start_codon:yes stop_codon:yes gene_type:complete
MTSPIPAGQTKKGQSQSHIEAVNAVFSLFRVNYHNQYYKAFPDSETLNTIKKLWLSSFVGIPAEVVVTAGERIIQKSEFLPTLAQMLQACCVDKEGNPLPDARSAFIEACNAPSPKINFAWSHSIVYHAGLKTGWHRLATSDENRSFPIFQQQYKNLLGALMRGNELPAIENSSLEPDKEKAAPLDRDAARVRLKELKKKLEG